MNKDNIIINSSNSVYDNLGYDNVLESPLYRLKGVTVKFSLKHNTEFNGRYYISTNKNLSEEEIKDEIISIFQ